MFGAAILTADATQQQQQRNANQLGESQTTSDLNATAFLVYPWISIVKCIN